MTPQELVERLREQVEPVYDVAPYQTTVARAEMLIAVAVNLTAAADRIEQLEAEKKWLMNALEHQQKGEHKP